MKLKTLFYLNGNLGGVRKLATLVVISSLMGRYHLLSENNYTLSLLNFHLIIIKTFLSFQQFPFPFTQRHKQIIVYLLNAKKYEIKEKNIITCRLLMNSFINMRW